MQQDPLAGPAGSSKCNALQYRSPIRGFLLGAIFVPECWAVLLHIDHLRGLVDAKIRISGVGRWPIFYLWNVILRIESMHKDGRRIEQ